jgi:CHAT domain-containing protein
LDLLRKPNIRNIVIVPDGVLSIIPFEALQLPGESSATPLLLIERATVFYTPAAGLLPGSSDRRPHWAPPWREQMIAFADPAPNGRGPGALGPLAVEPGSGQSLPKSVDEVRSIANLLAGRSELHIGADAKKKYLAEPGMRRVSLLHLSTHATSDYVDPERSRILFAPLNPAGPSDYLFLREIYGLDLKGVDLAVVSACDTEAGKLVRGEGVEGFGKAFLSAGARSTATTLWRVEAQATAEFMKQFYYGLTQGDSKAQALRRAKLKFLHSGSRLAHPRFWAAFVLTGDGLSGTPKFLSWEELGLGAGLLVLLALVARPLLRRVRGGRG